MMRTNILRRMPTGLSNLTYLKWFLKDIHSWKIKKWLADACSLIKSNKLVFLKNYYSWAKMTVLVWIYKWMLIHIITPANKWTYTDLLYCLWQLFIRHILSIWLISVLSQILIWSSRKYLLNLMLPL